MIQSGVLLTQCNVVQAVRATNSTDAAYNTTRTVLNQFDEPIGFGESALQGTAFAIIDLAPQNGGPGANAVRFEPFAVGSDTNTFKMLGIGWSYVKARSGQTGRPYWKWTELFEMLCTISTGCPAGLVGGVVLGTSYHADTIAINGTGGNDDVSLDIVSPANDKPAHFVASLKGFHKLEVLFDRNSSATSCNSFFGLL